MKIVPRARAEKIPSQAQRVFLSCAVANMSDREMLVEDLLSLDAGMDCVVLYVVDPPDTKAKDDEAAKALVLLEHELHGTQGLVLWVTKELLELEAEKMPVEYRLARKFNIPVLPIAKFAALLSEFTRKEGSWHAIARSDGEYRAKLHAQLEKLFVSKEQMEAIREKAFIAKLFLSYRKMDIEEARRFMKMLHDVEGFEAISIWYDNFLTLSDKFDDEIEKFIKETDAFTLLVTPNLLQPNAEGKPNFVQDKEYPSAQEKHKPIISVEALPTDFETFAKHFLGVDKTIPLIDNALRAAFCAKLGKAFNPAQMDSERAYHLGMAYLKGYGVDRDFDRAVTLLEKAAEAFSESALRAAEQLADMYTNGMGVSIDYRKALEWYTKATVISEQVFGITNPCSALCYTNNGTTCYAKGDYSQALEWYKKATAIGKQIFGAEDPATAEFYHNIGIAYGAQGNHLQALHWDKKALTVFEKVLGKEHPNTAASYNGIGADYMHMGDYSQALEWYKKALAVFEKVLGMEHPDTALPYDNIGRVCHAQGNHLQALEWFQKARTVFEKMLGKEHPNTARSYDHIGAAYSALGDHLQALEWSQKARTIFENILGKEHLDTPKSYNNIGVIYMNLGDYSQALTWCLKALELKKNILGEEHPDIATVYCNIGAIYLRQKDGPQVLASIFMAFLIRSHSLGVKHPKTTETLETMRMVFIANGGHAEGFKQWLKERMEKKTVAPQPKTVGFLGKLLSSWRRPKD